MRAFLEVVHGKYSGQCAGLEVGDIVRMGKSGAADQYFPDDPFMSPIHFSLALTESHLLMFDVGSSNGTLVNGVRSSYAMLGDGDRIFAGITEWKTTLEDATTPCEAGEAAATPIERTAIMLANQPGNLYALVDMAGHPERAESFCVAERHQILYNGNLAVDLADSAPYLLKINGVADCLGLLRRLWGKAAVVCFASPEPFDSVRGHLRHFLLATDQLGNQVFFRYFDPRVLRAFLPNCTAPERERFFGPITLFCVEGRACNLRWEFTPDTQEQVDLRTEDVRVFRGLVEFFRRAEPAALGKR